jgi:hypothetical protein
MKITIPVSVGELIDKITILEIKALFTDNEYVKKELKELNEIKNTITQFILNYVIELREVNQSLWKVEDKLRQKEKTQVFDEEFIELARSVYKLNDKRARIKKEINEKYNSYYQEVKVHKYL